MLSINTNLSSLIAQNSLKDSTNILNQAVERMTTGYKINHAKDNAANYSIATNMTTKIGAYQVAEDNALQGLEMMSTSLESLNQISDKLNRMRALAVQSQNGTYGTRSLSAINAEANALLDEITRINNSAEFNGIKLFNTGKMDVTNAGKELELNEQGFLQEVVKVDTTSMTKLSSVDPNATLAVGEYSISTPEELAKLATMTNAGLVEAGSTFTLANDIDIGAWCRANEANGGWIPIGNSTNAFGGIFNGNGYDIKNLYINRPSSNQQGLFASVQGTWASVIIKNLKMIDADVTGQDSVGAIIGTGANISNCSVLSSRVNGRNTVGGVCGGKLYHKYEFCYYEGQVSGNDNVGGCIGYLYYANLSNCYTKVSINGNSNVGGIAGFGESINTSKSIANIVGNTDVGGIVGKSHSPCLNSYFDGYVLGVENVGGIAGYADKFSGYFKFCIVEGNVSGEINSGALLGSMQTSQTIIDSYYYSKKTGENIAGVEGVTLTNNIDITVPCDYTLQVGSCGDSARSTLSYTTYIDFGELNNVLSSGIENAGTIEKIDNLVNIVAMKQTELGTGINRLESVLEEISTQYNNLVSSRSTLRDADMAEVSSDYIRQQILQQASATLMATANQSPAIALQLI